AAKFGEATARQLTGVYPASAPAILDHIAETATTKVPGTNATRVPGTRIPPGLEWLAAGARRGNSNNWVVAGRRTKSGRPILANDPHLQIEFPSVWYELHLISPDFDVAGVTIPGVPLVALG